MISVIMKVKIICIVCGQNEVQKYFTVTVEPL